MQKNFPKQQELREPQRPPPSSLGSTALSITAFCTTPRRRLVVQLVIFLLVTFAAPRFLCSGLVDQFYEEELIGPRNLGLAVASHIRQLPSANDFSTGVDLFDEEWAFGSHVMAVLGLAQVILAHPQLREDLLPELRTASRQLLQPALRQFGTDRWGTDGLAAAASGHGHAYLGYLALALSLARHVDPDPDWAAQHGRLIERLAKNLAASPYALLETYPGEAYPVDNASVVGAIALYDRVTGTDHQSVLDRFERELRARYLDQRSGLLYQSARADAGLPLGPARASGTALSVYFLSFANRKLASDLYGGLQKNSTSFAGFGGVYEYAAGKVGGGDIDSGPVLLGIGVSATGFTLAGARIFRDRKRFTTLLRTTTLFGMPQQANGQLRFASGGPLGDAILLAMLTAGPGAAP